MAGSISRFALLVSKFRGCLVGSLVGDCLGALPEVEQTFVAASATAARPDSYQLLGQDCASTTEGGALPYSMHTRMLRCVAESLLQCREFDSVDLVQRFSHENAVRNRFSNIQSAKNYGEGRMTSPDNLSVRERYQMDTVALRTVPFAMFYYSDIATAVEAVKESIHIWQRPRDSGISALLHCLATHLALQFDPIRPLNVDLFLDRLMSAMAEVEAGMERSNRPGPVVVNKDKWSLKKLEAIREMLRLHYDVQKAAPKLDDKTLESSSVPLAIYTFLQAQQQKTEMPKNFIERVLRNAISVSQTGDALASLSCSLIGSFHGIEDVPIALRKRCQGLQETVSLANRLALQFESRPPGLVDVKEITFVQRV